MPTLTTPSYITAQDLVDALSEPTYMAIFDDTNSNLRGTVDISTGVLTALRRSLVRVSSWLPSLYKKYPPESNAAGVPAGGDNIPTLLKDAQLDIAVILAYRRHPEYVKTYGADAQGPLYKEWVASMERIQAGTQQINPTNDSPPEVQPENVGGSSQADGSRIALSGPAGGNITPATSSNMGDF